MSSKLAYLALAGVVAVAAGCGGSSGSANRPPSPPSASPTPTLALDRGAVTFTHSDTRRLRHLFLADRSYLEHKGLKDAAEIRLRLLSGPKTFDCVPTQIHYTATGPGPDYCQPSAGAPIGTVILNAKFLSGEVPALVTDDQQDVTKRELHSTELGAAAAVLGHELGHAEQALLHSHNPPLAGVVTELQADCYGARMLAVATPRLIDAATQFVQHVPGDSRHGSASQRRAAFRVGVHQGACSEPHMERIARG